MRQATAKSEMALDAMGSPIRRAIVALLANGSKPVGEIAREFPVSRPAISKHLRILEAANLVRSAKNGNRNVFSLHPAGFDAARQWLAGFWQNALARFAIVAENSENAPDE